MQKKKNPEHLLSLGPGLLNLDNSDSTRYFIPKIFVEFRFTISIYNCINQKQLINEDTKKPFITDFRRI